MTLAIIGGGLTGISLAISLKQRGIPFTLYESHSSFTEIGAGINLGPSALRSFGLMSASLGDKILGLATRNPSPDEETWMYLRYGAASGEHADGEVLEELKAPPTGNLTFHRKELLALLAEEIRGADVRFGKKFVRYTQDDEGVKIEFEDGTVERAGLVIGCDGIHSRVRRAMFGVESRLSRPSYNNAGCYRAVIPVEKAVDAIGEFARRSQIFLGPAGYFIMYPVSEGKFVNCGAWPGRREGDWEGTEWVKHDQHDRLREDFKDWGENVKQLIALFPHNIDFWASYQHLHQPDRFWDGRILLIGDAAHAMPPHQGAGAAQGVEDAYVLAEVLAELDRHSGRRASVEAALQAFEEVRIPRFSEVHRFSFEAGPRWFDFFNLELKGKELLEWKKITNTRLQWIWGIDMVDEANKAKNVFHELQSQHS